MAIVVNSGASINLGSAITLPDEGTVSLWFYATWSKTDGVEHLFFDSRNVASSHFFYIGHFSNNSIYAGWYTGGVEQRVIVASGSYTLVSGWNHLSFAWRKTGGGSGQYLYLNGSLIGSSATAFTTWSTSGRPIHWGSHDGGDHPVVGRVAQLSIHSILLGSGTIAALAGGQTARDFPSGLQVYIRGTDPATEEIGGYATTLTLTNTTYGDDPSITVPIIATSAAVSTASAALSPTLALASTVAAQSAADAALIASLSLAGQADAVSSATAAMTPTIGLAATIASTADVSALLGVSLALAATADAVSTANAALVGEQQLAGSIDAVSTADAALLVGRALAGSIDALSAADGVLIATMGLSATIDAQSAVSGAAVMAWALAGLVAAGGAVGATLAASGGEIVTTIRYNAPARKTYAAPRRKTYEALERPTYFARRGA